MKILLSFLILFLAIILVLVTGIYLAKFHNPINSGIFLIAGLSIIVSADWLINKLIWGESSND